jgi:hypothetical protein
MGALLEAIMASRAENAAALQRLATEVGVVRGQNRDLGAAVSQLSSRVGNLEGESTDNMARADAAMQYAEDADARATAAQEVAQEAQTTAAALAAAAAAEETAAVAAREETARLAERAQLLQRLAELEGIPPSAADAQGGTPPLSDVTRGGGAALTRLDEVFLGRGSQSPLNVGAASTRSESGGVSGGSPPKAAADTTAAGESLWSTWSGLSLAGATSVFGALTSSEQAVTGTLTDNQSPLSLPHLRRYLEPRLKQEGSVVAKTPKPLAGFECEGVKATEVAKAIMDAGSKHPARTQVRMYVRVSLNWIISQPATTLMAQ